MSPSTADCETDAHRCRKPDEVLLEPFEAVDSVSMLDFEAAFKADAKAQECLPRIIGRVLDRTVSLNDQKDSRANGHTNDFKSIFQGQVKCPLTPSAYIERILKHTATSPCNLLVGLIYLQRLKDEEVGNGGITPKRNLRLTSYNTQRMLLTSIMLACKFHDEPFVSNKQWALVGDMSTAEMNALEREMLFCLKFSLMVSREEYERCFDCLLELDLVNNQVSTSTFRVRTRTSEDIVVVGVVAKQDSEPSQRHYARISELRQEVLRENPPHGPGMPASSLYTVSHATAETWTPGVGWATIQQSTRESAGSPHRGGGAEGGFSGDWKC
jgi:hypothetical protein